MIKFRRLLETTAAVAFISWSALVHSAAAGDATTANPNPTAGERAAAKVGNEIDEAVGPSKPITDAEMKTAVSLSKIADPEQALSTAAIKNPQGEAVGTVASVDVAANGKAKAVHANVGGFLGMGDRVVAFDADKLSYIKSRNILVTRLSKDEIKLLPTENAPGG